MKEDVYVNDFAKFLLHTNEKRVLQSEIEKIIVKKKINSLLDIGAGNGLLSIPLSKKVNQYLAIEPKVSYARILRNAGLEVIQEEFPIKINKMFEMVLLSHSIPYSINKYNLFIENAWKLVKQNGILLIITYRGKEDNWTQLMDYLGASFIDRDHTVFKNMLETLSSFGNLQLNTVFSSVKTDNIEDMIEALSFVFSNGKQERKKEFFLFNSKLHQFLNKFCKTAEGYIFQFQHIFISTKKNNHLIS